MRTTPAGGFEGLPMFVLTTTPGGKILAASGSLLEALGRHRSEVLDAGDIAELLTVASGRASEQARACLCQLDEPRVHRCPLVKRDGEQLSVQWYSRPLYDQQGEVACVENIGVDVSEVPPSAPKIASQEVSVLDRVPLALALDHVAEHLVITDADGDIVYVNTAFEAVSGWTREVVLGKNLGQVWDDVLEPEPLPQVEQGVDLPGITRVERIHKNTQGMLYLDELSIAILRDQQGKTTHRVIIGRDVTARRLTDPMTGLETRALLLERVRLGLARLRRDPDRNRFALLFVDVDCFKAINDTYGRTVGDQVILALGQRIRAVVREADIVAQVSHINRDEFAVFIEGLRNPAGAPLVAERIIEAALRPTSACGCAVTATISVGVAVATPEYAAAEDLLRDAETAMQRAKRSTGGSYQVFDPELHEQVVHRMRVSAELRRAITVGDIVVYYQPIVSLRTGEITGAEALARWRHASGLIQPQDFIPAAEEQGLVGLLGESVLADACQQMRAWHQAGFAGCSISVNVSAQQLRDSKFVDAVATSIARSGLDPTRLKLELTEGTAAEDPDVLATRLLEFKRLGVDVLLDDFGTGYSSLSYLTRFPIHKLKIDRTFVQRAPNSPHDATIATTIVAMAHSLGYGVIAEGVETEQQLNFLRAAGCDEMQGFLFSPPVPATEFGPLLEAAASGRISLQPARA